MKFLILLKIYYLSFLYFVVNNFVQVSSLRAIVYNILHPNFRIANGVKFRSNITFYGGSGLNGKLIIDKNSFINNECFIDYSSSIIIGKNVNIGMRVMILSSTHSIGDPVRCGITKKKETIIKDNSWLGAGSIVFPGVKIGQGSVISAGEVVDFDVPDNMLLKKGKLTPIKMKEFNI
jgi:acetyltransferase-like isoleucine patch superfamily enzyme